MRGYKISIPCVRCIVYWEGGVYSLQSFAEAVHTVSRIMHVTTYDVPPWDSHSRTGWCWYTLGLLEMSWSLSLCLYSTRLNKVVSRVVLFTRLEWQFPDPIRLHAYTLAASQWYSPRSTHNTQGSWFSESGQLCLLSNRMTESCPHGFLSTCWQGFNTEVIEIKGIL